MEKIAKLIYENSNNASFLKYKFLNNFKSKYFKLNLQKLKLFNNNYINYYKQLQLTNNKYIDTCIDITLNKYCNCNANKKYIYDSDAYGYWIICSYCNIWCGWVDDDDFSFFDIKGNNAIDNVNIWDIIKYNNLKFE